MNADADEVINRLLNKADRVYKYGYNTQLLKDLERADNKILKKDKDEKG